MRLRHLGWAGIEIEASGGQTLLIDCLRGAFPLIPADATVAPSGRATAALVTHLHSDHADPPAIAAALAADGVVLRPEPTPGTGDDLLATARAEAQCRDAGLTPRVVRPWDTLRVGPFHILATPAVDGLGDPQVSWVVECDGTRILHAGDTMFHGYWWAVARAAGPIDLALLPINGAVVRLPHLQPPSPLAAVMSPEEAAVAAHLLGCRRAAPIHFDVLNRPPEYTETPRPAERFQTKAAELGVPVFAMDRGEWFRP